MPHALVVDDDPLFCSLVQTWLERDGIDTVAAGSAAEALHAFDRFEFDVMLVDIFMPERDGLDTISAFHRQAPKLPIIVMSGVAPQDASSSVPDFFSMAIELGASQSLHKPFARDQLASAITRCLSKPCYR